MKKRVLLGLATLVLCSASLFAASQDLTAEGSKNLRSADMHKAGGRFEKALPFYELVLEENPHHIETLNKIAGIYFDVDNNYKKANDLYVKILAEIDEVYAEYDELLKTDEKAAKKFYKKNIKKPKLEELKELTPKLIKSCWAKLFMDAQTDAQNENLQSALDKFMVILEIAPDSVSTLKMISFIYAKLGDDAQSLNYMIQVAEKDPTDDMVRTQLGNTSFENGNYEDAVFWYRAAADINPEGVDNYFNMALAYSKLKDQDNTLMAYEKVLEFEPDNLDALIYASGILEKQGNVEQSLAYLETALAKYTEVLKNDPENVDALAFSSTIYEKLGNIDESINSLKKAIALKPENKEWISYLAYTLTREKRYEEALIYAEKWLVLDPASEDAKMTINLAKQMMNK